MSGTLILCATPIGNLEDASPRLAATLQSVNVIYAEDTRRTRVLLEHLGVGTELRSYHIGNEAERAEELRRRLEGGETVALVTDAGAPSVSDPGVSAVRAALAAGAIVSTVPGPSAVTAALTVAGFGADRFVFEGFLPRSGARRAGRLEALAGEQRTAVLFASPNRVATDLADLAEVCGGSRGIVVARELTKVHEEVWRGDLAAAAAAWAGETRGEITIVLEGAPPASATISSGLEAVDLEVASGSPLSAAVRSVAEALGISRRELYEAALDRNRRSS